jgi:uncharacterized protein (TIGR00661 family)
MSKVYFGVAGEGRGHAIRSLVLAENLVQEGHSVTIFTGGQAYEFLKHTVSENIKIKYIPVLRFGYKNGKINSLKTIIKNFYYMLALPLLIRMCGRAIGQGKPDLVISDFEPLMARAAVRKKIPIMTVDHQQVIAHAKLLELPWTLRVKAYLTSVIVRLMTPYQDYGIASSFYKSELKRKYKRIIQVGPFLRPCVLDATPRQPDIPTILVYFKKHVVPPRVVHSVALFSTYGWRVIIYGQEDRDINIGGMLQYKAVSNDGFIQDLANCTCVISGSGNQLIGEAMWLGKPVLVCPETKQWEQEINGFYINHMGIGMSVKLEDFNSSIVGDFLKNIAAFQARCMQYRCNGNSDAMSFLRMVLAQLPGGFNCDFLSNSIGNPSSINHV